MLKTFKNFSLLILILLLCLGLSTPLAWGAFGSISGTVTDSTGATLDGIKVNVYHQNHVLIASAPTNVDGIYSLDYLPEGSYKVEFMPDQIPGIPGYLSQWYGNKNDFTSATLVAVTSGTITANINASLTIGGSISGSVTGTTAPGGLVGITVTIYDATNTAVGDTVTGITGTYNYANLPAGKNYKVRFSRDAQLCTADVWYSAKVDISTSNPIEVIAGQITTGINALLPSGKLQGTIVNSATGIGMVGFIPVNVYAAATGTFIDNVYSTYLTGIFNFVDLAPGNYKLQIISPLAQYPTTWYDGKYTISNADSITIVDGATATANVTLLSGGSIAGKVSDVSGGAGISGVRVEAYDSVTGDKVTFATTSASGTYTLQGLPVGQSYKIKFTLSGYDTQWYNNSVDQITAIPVTVISATSPVTSINATLAKSVDSCANTGGISGQVLDPSGAANPDANVTVYNTAGTIITSTISDATGNYTMTCIPDGVYKIIYNDMEYLYVATVDTTVTAPALTSIPAVTLAFGGSIVGRVINSAGEGIANVDVMLFDAANNRIKFGITTTNAIIDTITTDIQGYYVANGLASGNYTVKASQTICGGVASAWYNNQAPVSVSAPNSVNDVNITLSNPQNNPRLTVQIAGPGTGSVTSSPAGVNCSSGTCINTFPPATITLTPSPAAGSLFAGWSGGGCSGTGTCVIALNTDTTVTATFNSLPVTRTVSVSVSGTGSGSVSSNPAGINCTSGTCANQFDITSPVTLTPTAITGSLFAGWNGGVCNGSGTCVIPAGSTTETTTATFIPATVKMGGTYWSSIAEAYSGAVDGVTIQITTQNPAETVIFNKGITLSLFGGYNSSFLTVSGTSTLQAPFTIKSGKVAVANIVVR